MNSRKLIEWAKSPGGKSVLGLLAIITFVLVVYFTSTKPAPGIDKTDQIYLDENREIRYQRDLTNFKPVQNYDQHHKPKEHSDNNPKKIDNTDLEPTAKPIDEDTQTTSELAEADNLINEIKQENDHTIKDGGTVENGQPLPRESLRDRIERKKRELLQRRLGNTNSQSDPGGIESNGVQPKAARNNPLPLSLYTAPVTASSTMSGRFAPFGRMLKCELVVTIDSARINTPIIGLVTEDLWHNGVRIIPAGAEVHGKASRSSMRDRIEASGTWNIVWRTKDADNGKELTLKGTALTYTKLPNQQKWDITDGSAGIKGYVVDNTDWQDLLAVAAVFLSGVGEGMNTSELTTTGSTTRETFGGKTEDAIGKGLQRAMQLYAQRMLETVNRDGAFVRVPAGSQFYLYIQETINMDKAIIAGSVSNIAKRRRN